MSKQGIVERGITHVTFVYYVTITLQHTKVTRKIPGKIYASDNKLGLKGEGALKMQVNYFIYCEYQAIRSLVPWW